MPVIIVLQPHSKVCSVCVGNGQVGEQVGGQVGEQVGEQAGEQAGEQVGESRAN